MGPRLWPRETRFSGPQLIFTQIAGNTSGGGSVTGSGSAVFALCRSREDAIRVANEFPRTDESVYVLRGLDAETPR